MAGVVAASKLACARRAAGVGFACACMLAHVPAHAGPVEQLVDVAFAPSDAPTLVARYVNGGGGLIYSADRGRSWRLQCNSAFLAPNETDSGPLLVLANGTLLFATSQGIVAGQADACDFHRELSLESELVVDLAADPTDPSAAIALLRSTTSVPPSSSLRRRSAGGSWAVLGAPDDRLATSLRVAAVDGRLRIYEAALLASPPDATGGRFYTYKLRYSDDAALSFHEFPLAADAVPRVIAVDPMNPDHVAVLIKRNDAADSILISRDRGATLTAYLQLGDYGGLAWAADGRLWIGGSADGSATEQGVWGAANLDSAPARLTRADYAVQCLGYDERSATLYACQHFWLGEVDPSSGAFATALSLAKVDDFVGCAGSNTAASCELQLCNAYCGPGHFAIAPVCAAYDTPACGGPVAKEESNAMEPALVVEQRDAAAAAIPAAAAIDGGAPARGAARAPATGSCGISRANRTHATAPWLALLAALFSAARGRWGFARRSSR